MTPHFSVRRRLSILPIVTTSKVEIEIANKKSLVKPGFFLFALKDFKETKVSLLATIIKAFLKYESQIEIGRQSRVFIFCRR